MLTRALARALRPRCGSAVSPGHGPVEPEQEERRAAEAVLDRIGSPDDVTDAILYLTGAHFVTGTTIVVDGGRLLQTGRNSNA